VLPVQGYYIHRTIRTSFTTAPTNPPLPHYRITSTFWPGTTYTRPHTFRTQSSPSPTSSTYRSVQDTRKGRRRGKNSKGTLREGGLHRRGTKKKEKKRKGLPSPIPFQVPLGKLNDNPPASLLCRTARNNQQPTVKTQSPSCRSPTYTGPSSSISQRAPATTTVYCFSPTRPHAHTQ
jgi:hypothetical protein